MTLHMCHGCGMCVYGGRYGGCVDVAALPCGGHSGMHTKLRFVEPATASAVLNISNHVRLHLELHYFFWSECESQPPLNVSLFPDTATAITDVYNIAPGLCFDENTTILKNLTIESILPFPKGRVPCFDGLFAFCTKTRNKTWEKDDPRDTPAVEAAGISDITQCFEASNPFIEQIPAKSVAEEFIRRFVRKTASFVGKATHW